MIDGADILGDGVNVAARLEGIAEPGGICISSSVYDQIAGKLNMGFVDLGEQSLKNITRPIRVYQFDRGGAAGGVRRAQASRRKSGAIAGGIALLVLAAVGAWQAGWFDRRAEPKPALAPAAPPVAVAPAPGSEEMKLKLQIAEAERAKAEAELARARTDNEAAKQRADAEQARQRTTARVAAPDKKDAPAATASPSSVAPPVTMPAPAPALPAEPPPTLTPPASAATAAPKAATVTKFVSVANGTGTATRECEGFEELRAFSETQLAVRVEDGVIIVERGTAGQVGYLFAKGRPTADGQLVLAGIAISPTKRNYGKEIKAYFTGAYADGAFALNGRTGSRNCKMTIRLDAPR
jgi:hypothetical protein